MAQQPLHRLATTPWFLTAIPETRSDSLPRPRLTDMLDAAVEDSAITIVEAPSGFGKTTALATWAHARTRTAWLTLTDQHRTPLPLLAGIISSLIRIYPGNAVLEAEMLRVRTGEVPLDSAIERIIDAIPEGSPTVVIVDDAQETTREALVAAAVPLARHSRGHLRFIIAGTSSLSRSLSRELAKGDAHRLAPDAFAFTHEEMVKIASRWGVDDESLHEAGRCLWEETRGWPVAVQLLLRTGHLTETSLVDPEAPNILTDYIEHEVLDVLSTELREFILDATSSDRVSADYVVHLTGDGHSPALLDECRRLGLFLELFQNDDGRTSLRWHTRFAQSCREIARRRDRGRFHRNHRRTAQWLVPDFPSAAISHALEVDDEDFALAMLEDVWLQMITTGQASVLESRCLDVLKGGATTPSLLYIRACCREMESDSIGAQMLKSRADDGLAALAGDEQRRAHITRTFADLLLASSPEHLQTALTEAEELLTTAHLGPSLFIHGTFIAAWNHLKLRSRPAHALRLMTTAAASAEKAGFTAVSQRANSLIASALTLSGRFTAAMEILAATPESAGQGPWDPFEGNLNRWSRAFISFWQGDIDAALAGFRSIDGTDAPASSDVGIARMYFAFAAVLSGERDVLDEATRMVRKLDDRERHGLAWPTYKSVASAALDWARGDKTAATRTLSDMKEGPGAATTRIIGAALWRRLGRPDRALQMLGRIDQDVLVSFSRATMQVTLAVIAWQRGQADKAHEMLERALDVASAEGITAPFLCLDQPALELMTTHAGWGTKHEEFVALRLGEDAARTDYAGPAALLSERELDVYGFLGTTMTPEEIAQALFVSTSTVRTHQRSIYRKLGVTNRRDAVRAGL